MLFSSYMYKTMFEMFLKIKKHFLHLIAIVLQKHNLLLKFATQEIFKYM